MKSVIIITTLVLITFVAKGDDAIHERQIQTMREPVVTDLQVERSGLDGKKLRIADERSERKLSSWLSLLGLGKFSSCFRGKKRHSEVGRIGNIKRPNEVNERLCCGYFSKQSF